MNNTTITIRKPDDFHIHIRQDSPMISYLEDYQDYVARIVPMPNTQPAITTPELMLDYQRQIVRNSTIKPIMIFKLHDGQDPTLVPQFVQAGAIAAKLYPVGATTNAEEGVTSVRKMDDMLKSLEENNVVLSIHGELMTSQSLDREYDFHSEILYILENFPKLRVVLEHLSDRRSADFVQEMSKKHKLAGTITVHHPLIDLDDLLGGNLNPHHFCKPIVKRREDKKRLMQAMISGEKCFFYGSDSAPHPVADKVQKGAAGLYTAPVAIPLLTQIFDENGKLDILENYTSKYGADFYELPYNEETITLVKEPWQVHERYSGVCPFMAKETLDWQLEN